MIYDPEKHLDTIVVADCLDYLRSMPSKSVDLVFGSPPYEDARTYGIGYRLKGKEWVEWMLERWHEFDRVSRGPVVMVVNGRTRNYRWSGTPILLMAALIDDDKNLRKPKIYGRAGIPGSGGPDDFRDDYEFCVMTTPPGRLPWSDNTACGHPPKYPPGGAPSHHTKNGRVKKREYKPPKLANPGNLILGKVGKGHMGSDLSHENEAAFPEWIAERFVRSFCPPGGVVLDPFIGSGTTAAVAIKHGRHFIGIDVRDTQQALSERRVAEAKKGTST